MPLTLSPCHPTDAPALALTSQAIWSRIPRNSATFANVPVAALLSMYEKDFHDGMTLQREYKRPQQKHYLKVTDDATGEIAACGVWVFLPEGYCADDEYVGFFSGFCDWVLGIEGVRIGLFLK